MKLFLAMAYADAAYCDEKTRKASWEIQKGAKGVSVGSDYVMFKDNVAAFRGSDDLLDWKSNFDVGTVNGCHKGFWEAIQGLSGRLRSWGKAYSNLTLIGHSRGGGLATVAARYLQSRGRKDISVVSFAAPPIGTKAYCKECSFPIIRVVCGRDIVPRIDSKLLNWHHYGRRKRVNPPPWTWAFPGTWAIMHHRRWAYWYGVKSL